MAVVADSSKISQELSDALAIFSFISNRDGPSDRSPQLQQRLRAAVAPLAFLNTSGILLDSRELGVIFPMIHFTDDPKSVKTRLYESSTFLNYNALGEEWNLKQGVYRKMREIVPTADRCHLGIEDSSSYILIGFKCLERTYNQVLVDSWKKWTGARSVYFNLPQELGLSKISFYCRETPEDLEIFMYLVLVECRAVSNTEKLYRLLDFTQRLRVERMTGYISVYSPLQYSTILSAVNATVSSPTVEKHTDATKKLLEKLNCPAAATITDV